MARVFSRGVGAPGLQQRQRRHVGECLSETGAAVSAFVLLTFALAGCVSGSPPAILPVGPFIASAEAPRPDEGALVVLTPFERQVRDSDEPRRESYEILSEAGAIVRVVPPAREPVAVRLPPGVYRVRAAVSGYGLITVPVVLSALRTTTLHLDGHGNHLRQSFPEQSLVALPDGRVIGIRGPIP